MKSYDIYHVNSYGLEQFALKVVAVSAKMALKMLRGNRRMQLPNGRFVLRNTQDAGDELVFDNHLTFRGQVAVPGCVCRMIDRYLSATSEDDYQDENNTVSYTVTFPDGVQMDIKCCGSQDGASWTEAVLFDRYGNQIGCSEPGGEFFGAWEIDNNGTVYIGEALRESEK